MRGARVGGPVRGPASFGLVALGGLAAWFVERRIRRAAAEESERKITILKDEIEAHARTNAELRRAKDAAEAANLAKSRYIIGVSHEIRTPLNAISGYAQLLERNPEQPVGEGVRVIRHSATHLADLVDGLVDVSRIENGVMRIARDRVNLTELIDQIADMFRIQAATRGIAFEHTRAPNLPVWIHTDQKRLRQILINLVSNAIKYTPSGLAALHVRWRNPIAEFIVQDTGVGIDPANLERIFEPFQRLETVRGQPGVGLGLTLARMLVDVMGGQLTVESQPGAGSTFRVKMFLSEAMMRDEAAARPPRVRQRSLPRRRVLVVDDDRAHLDLVSRLLATYNLDLEFAEDGEAAISACDRRLPDLVIMDVAMPGIDGWEAAREIRRRHGGAVPILMVSANVQDFQRPRRADDPHDDFLLKPYVLDTLVERIFLLLELDGAGMEAGA